MPKVAYLGPPGTFTHQAACSAFTDQDTYIPVVNLSDITSSVVNSSTDFGVLPFENSTNGHVVPSLDLLRDCTGFEVVGEIYLDVHKFLLSTTRIEKFNRLYSHLQAFGQCETFLSSELKGVERINVSSTGLAAQMAAKDPESGSIGSARSADSLQGMKILAANIEDHKDNTTRFLILSKQEQAITEQPYKSLFSIRTDPTPGSLAGVLQAFADAQVNLTSICSRPHSLGAKWDYMFFIECEGHRTDPTVKKAFTQVSSAYPSSRLTHLGSFIDRKSVHDTQTQHESQRGARTGVIQ